MDMYIDGEWVRGEDRFDILNPATGEVVDRVPEGSVTDVDNAVKAAARAFPGYSALPLEERHDMMKRSAAALKERAGDMAPLLTREQGKPLEQAKQEIFYSGMVLEQFVGLEPAEEPVKETETARIFTVPEPLGVCGLILPWNFPAAVLMWKLAPALLTGNTAVIKPSPFTPLTNLRTAEVLGEFFPKGVVNVVTGGDRAGKALVKHPGVAKIAFTGHVETGPKITQGSGVKHLTLELGGNDAAVVLEDYDPASVKDLWNYVFRNGGQICTAIKRIYVQETVLVQFLEAFLELTRGLKVGNGLDEGVTMGPVNNREQFFKVRRLVQDALDRGAKAETGGAPLTGQGYTAGNFYPPTVLTGCQDDWPIVAEEQFGPAVPILTFRTEDEVVERVNSTRFGLGGSVWTRDAARGERLARRLQSGIVWVNAHGAFDTSAPFGGFKDSGIGKELGRAGAEQYVNRKTVYVKKG